MMLLNVSEMPTANEQIFVQLSVVKGMFNRNARENQWTGLPYRSSIGYCCSIMDVFTEIESAIHQRDSEAILTLTFDSKNARVRPGLANETHLWDFKQGCPSPGKDKADQIGWAHIAADVLGFHNNRGGVIIFGVRDQSLTFCGIRTRLDGKLFNDQIRKYLSDRIPLWSSSQPKPKLLESCQTARRVFSA